MSLIEEQALDDSLTLDAFTALFPYTEEAVAKGVEELRTFDDGTPTGAAMRQRAKELEGYPKQARAHVDSR